MKPKKIRLFSILKIELAALVCLGFSTLVAIEKPSAPPTPPRPPAAPNQTPVPTLPAPETAPAPAIEPPLSSDRGAAYKTFREHFDARRFADALPAAEEVVKLSEQKFGPDQPELITPLTNLGTTQLRLSDYTAAEKSFQRALKIVETREGGFSRDILRPLLGLGATYTAAGQHADAAEVLRQAVDVSRRLDGLFNLQQTELLGPLIESYLALGRDADAEREQQYALRLSEVAYGKDDPRMLPALDRGARWYEEAGRYFSARTLQARALEIIRKTADNNDLRMVEPLRGIARSFLLEYLYGAESVSEDLSSKIRTSGMEGGSMSSSGSQLDSASRIALESALKILKENPKATPAQRGTTLIDLGDWYQVSGDKRSAMKTYKEAWKELSGAEGPGTAALNAPLQLAYRGPRGSSKRPPAEPEDYDVRFVEVEFTVTADGLVTDVGTVAKDTTEALEKSVVNSIKQARYRPRFVDGEPVSTSKVHYRQTIYVKRSKKD